MVTPAASPIQKRYTAGGCTLDVVLHLSALSQWYPQPIVQDLQFKLWVQSPRQPGQLAKRGRDVATLPRLIAEGDRTVWQEVSQYLSQKVHSELAIAHLSKSAPPPPEPSPFLNLTQPLSYLQLCDLTIVMRQCEQASRMLPVATVSVPEAVSSSATQAARHISPPRSTRSVIPFAAVRHRPKLWVSSAAAALLAVGLTTAVWQNSKNSPSLTTATAPAELDSSRPNVDLVPNADLAPDTALPRDAVEPPESTVESNTEPAFIPPFSSDEQNNTPAPAPPQVIATTPSVEAVQPPAKVQREPAPLQGAAAAEREAISEAVPEPPTVQLPAQTEALATRPEAAAPSPQSGEMEAEEMEDDISDRELDSAFGRTSERVPSRAAARQASPIPNLSSDMSDVPEEGAIRPSLSPTDQMIVQAQPYFQRQWTAVDVALEEALIYTMRISELGDVTEFEAGGATAEEYRDRLQPEGLVIDMTQEDLGAIASVTFRIEITPNGQVQITQMP